ncbi:MAG TPA: DUF427 domain-containing protein [Caulobacteraceae bacterium]|jgi:uncharacterized protein (DUF427 family)|nr:DUF427 domain-containing protein [Caulobacteraceae bacterium]
MKIPGPDHPITVTANPKRLQVSYNGHVIADTRTALTLQESTYPAVQYFDRADVEMSVLRRTEKTSYCPYKGEAHYFTLDMDGVFADDAVWTYETPYPAMEIIKERVAFYPNKVEIYEVEGDVPADPAAIRDTILHTDDGAGSSQKEHW